MNTVNPRDHDGSRATAPTRHSADRAPRRRRTWLVALAALATVAVVTALGIHLATSSRDAHDGARAAGYPSGLAGRRAGTPTASNAAATGQSPAPVAVASRSPRPSHNAAHATAKPALSTRKGVSVWTFNGVDRALADSGAGWYYTWSTGHDGIAAPHGVQFVPQIWGGGSVTSGALAQAKAAGPYLLGFNEPDLAAQSNMTVQQALDLWPRLESAGRILGSPAVASGGATPGGWLDRFMSGARQRGYRVDFIALHWYGGDFTTSDAVGQLRSYLQAVYDRYHKPIWLTEFALINFSNGTHYPTEAAQAAFLTAAAKMLDGLPFLQRYAWFALPASDNGPSTGLFTSGPAATEVGRAFEAAH
jgi:hypothetical protein